MDFSIPQDLLDFCEELNGVVRERGHNENPFERIYEFQLIGEVDDNDVTFDTSARVVAYNEHLDQYRLIYNDIDGEVSVDF